MKLENFKYSIVAAREHNYYRVQARSDQDEYDFRVHSSASLGYIVVISEEFVSLLEERRADEAMALRARLTSIFVTHRAAIDAATAGSIDFVKVYDP
jgi:hypothetical protein